MFKAFMLTVLVLLAGCVSGASPDNSDSGNAVNLESFVRADPRIVASCNIVNNVSNSSNVALNNSLECPNPKKDDAADSDFCLHRSQMTFTVLYPTQVGLVGIPLLPFIPIVNYVSKKNAESEANSKYTACMEAHGHIMNGYGSYTFSNGNIYQGNWKDGTFNGEGILLWKEGGRYDGKWKDGVESGNGFILYSDGVTYKGAFENGVKNGYGVQTWPDGGRFEGTFRDDRPDGHGLLVEKNGDRYEGIWSNGCFREGERWAIVGQLESYCR